jgi:Raf kinase inhibitor-like YbhB/YbcL family protein
MKKAITVIILIIILGFAAGIIYKYSGKHTTVFNNQEQQKINTTTPMTITSAVFADNQAIPKQYTCDGAGINPPLQFGSVPSEAKSLALLVEDPDAPTGIWIHWLMWNIPPTVNQIAENSVPTGAVQGQESSGQNVFGAPCPPSGIHHYIFTVYALDSTLTLPSYSTAENLQAAMQGHIIEQAQIIGLYGR